MMGLMILLFFAVYLGISLWVISYVFGWAAKSKRSRWWGVLAIFVMYNLVFWDWVPTVVMHKYYCSTQAGFWVYKTPEQWVRENPELTAEDLKIYGRKINWNKLGWDFPYKKFEGNPNKGATMINKRVYLDSEPNKNMSELLPIHKITSFIADVKNDKKLAQQITFASGYGNPMTNGGLLGFKGWLANSTCDDNVGIFTVEYNQFIRKLISLGVKK